jgi:hypothetical protein
MRIVKLWAQNGKTLNYHYDPAGRARETETVVKGKTESTMISHYSGPGEALTWTSEGSEKWSRNIPGIDGALDAIQTSSGTTTLLLHDLQGNIIATAGTSEAETKLLTTYNSTEFGVPGEGKTPPKYAWLGATGVTTELAAGVATKGGASYVSQIARDLQTEPVVPPGAFPNGQGSGSPYISEVSGWSVALSQAQSAEVIAEELAKQEAARKKAEEEARHYSFGGDPPEEAVYFTLSEAEFWYVTIAANETFDLVYDFGKYLKHTILEPVVEWVEEELGVHDLEDWIETIKSGLGECIGTGELFDIGLAGRCRVGIPMVTIFEINVLGTVFAELEIPDFRKLPNIEVCAYYGTECIPA